MSLIVDIKKELGDFVLESKFSFDKGIFGLFGASGAGKSMTLRCIAGIEKPDSGRIILNGETLFDSERNINLSPQKRGVGYLFQDYALFPNMSVKKNILCGLSWEKNTVRREVLAKEIIEKLMLTGLEDRKPFQLSGGEKQRVSLGRILVNRPELLLLDEPFSALDTQLRDQLESEMAALLQEYGKKAVLVSHSRDEILYLCESMAVIDGGRIVKQEKISSKLRKEEMDAQLPMGYCLSCLRKKRLSYLSKDVFQDIMKVSEQESRR